VTDTPGLLNRTDDDRNAMERLTLATLQHLPTAVLFVTDLTGDCGTNVGDQWAIRAELRARFPGKAWVDVLSKADLLQPVFEEADALAAGGRRFPAQTGVGPSAAEYASALPAAVRVSSISGDGIPALKDSMLAMLEEARKAREEEKKDVEEEEEEDDTGKGDSLNSSSKAQVYVF
jgi:GTPase Era involved in 16S rRNA processing